MVDEPRENDFVYFTYKSGLLKKPIPKSGVVRRVRNGFAEVKVLRIYRVKVSDLKLKP